LPSGVTFYGHFLMHFSAFLVLIFGLIHLAAGPVRR
jgi:hypothetical protein